MRFGMWFYRIFRCLVIIPDLFIIRDIVRYEYFLKTVFLTFFGNEDIAVFKYDFGIDLSVTDIAKADRMVVVYIIPIIHLL